MSSSSSLRRCRQQRLGTVSHQTMLMRRQYYRMLDTRKQPESQGQCIPFYKDLSCFLAEDRVDSPCQRPWDQRCNGGVAHRDPAGGDGGRPCNTVLHTGAMALPNQVLSYVSAPLPGVQSKDQPTPPQYQQNSQDWHSLQDLQPFLPTLLLTSQATLSTLCNL